MVRIRLRRMGSKKQPFYRIVVADKESPRDGAFVEVIGTYNPRTKPESILVDEPRAWHWLRVGAQPSDSVAQLLKKAGTMGRFERLKQGEPQETLAAEATSAQNAAVAATDMRTRVGRVAQKRTTPFKKKKE
jgi:small subunit ribosomal protein S16